MSDQRPDKAEPPYPGWSTEQPPEGPDVSGRPDPGWQSPGAAPGEAGQGSQPGWGDQPPPATPPAAGQQSWGTPADPAGQGQSWSSQPQWGWAAPKVKPGVIPLRPLGVGEILDGAVTTIRKNLGAMLGSSVIVALFIQLGGLYFTWTVLTDLYALEPTATNEQIVRVFGSVLTSFAIYAVLTWIGVTILSGTLTIVVSRAVLGERVSMGQAWRQARSRLLRLLGLTVIYALVAIGPLVAAGLLTFLLVLATGPAAGFVGFPLTLAAIPICVWLLVRYVLAAPTLMIETVKPPDGAPVPIGVFGSLRRSSALVRNSWWRVFGICLLVVVIAWIVWQAVQAPFSYPLYISDPYSGVSFGLAVLISLGAAVAMVIAAPFVAGSLALLYIDRRIRAEGLDIELAKAAGVTIPGRTDEPPDGTAHGPGPQG